MPDTFRALSLQLCSFNGRFCFKLSCTRNTFAVVTFLLKTTWFNCVCFTELHCLSSPCLNQGTCAEDFASNTFNCTCMQPFTGERCQNGQCHYYTLLKLLFFTYRVVHLCPPASRGMGHSGTMWFPIQKEYSGLELCHCFYVNFITCLFVTVKLFSVSFVPLLAPNRGDATAYICLIIV